MSPIRPSFLGQAVDPNIMGGGSGWRRAIVLALVLVCGASPARADIELSLYGDTDAVLATTGTRRGTQLSFSAAKLDVFTTTTLGRWTLLAETVFEAGIDNAYSLDVERVQIGYVYREWLRVFMGRFHTALGYYNDAFHHGAFFMVPVGRPAIVEFEDEGGLIPAHNIGIHADGRFPLGEHHLRYDLEVANGRAADPVVVQNSKDTNRPKAFNLRLRFEPAGRLDGLVVGGNVYFDSIPGSSMPRMTESGVPVVVGPVHEWIVGVHAAYFEHGINFVTEAIMVQHTELDTGVRHRTYAAFVEAGHAINSFTPYGRYEWARYPHDGDPYYLKAFADGTQTASVGVKHATTDNVALKAQAGVTLLQAAGSDPLFTLTGQVAFAF
jgi:hypothetical protein